ncbi:hypothetical protein LCGC14_2143900 [marine sediment metagenome]|uniref:Uncharacterized protein n=1 Tax=marine sediment metagenome TaxID=412755 RepID=A0A0F9EJT0_9ZZZZ
MVKTKVKKSSKQSEEKPKLSDEKLEELKIAQTISVLRDEGEFRYYLLNSLTEINENIKKLGQVLVNIGKLVEKESSEEDEDDDEDEEDLEDEQPEEK